MNTILEAIGDYLDADPTLNLTLGTNLFLARMQPTPDVCVAVYEYEGAAPIETMRSGVSVVDLPRIQVVCRAGRDDYPVARDKAIAIRDLLGAITEQTLSGVSVMRVRALGSILPLGFDSEDRPTVAINFECHVGR